MSIPFRGTGIAIITPFNEDKSIDFNGLENLIDHLINGGVEYIVSLGSTGESATLNRIEKIEVLEFTVEKVKGRIPIVAGFGGNNTQQVIEDIASFHFNGVDAILSVSPYYNKPTQSGIYNHYAAIAGSTEMPIILYNVPGRTSSNLTSGTTLKLAHDFTNIIAVKEASGDLVQCMEIVQGKPDGFAVISGEDALTLPMLSFGMDGVISVIGNAFPQEFSDMVRLGLDGNFEQASNLHFRLLKMIEYIFSEGNPGGIKSALKCLKICQDYLRLPLAPISEELAYQIREECTRIINNS